MRDDQAEHEAFEQLCGGPDRAFRLLRVSISARQSVAGNPYTLQKMPTYEQVFKARAKREGFTPEEIQAFLALP